MAQSATAQAPEELDVVRRDLRFDFTDCDFRNWHPDGLHVAHFFNALSIFFPEGERFFMDSVRHYRDRVRRRGWHARSKASSDRKRCTAASTDATTRRSPQLACRSSGWRRG